MMLVTDEYITVLFQGTNFGDTINNSVDEQRALIARTLRNQIDGYWSGHTAYHIVVDGGFLKDAKVGAVKHLTKLGHLFLLEFEVF